MTARPRFVTRVAEALGSSARLRSTVGGQSSTWGISPGDSRGTTPSGLTRMCRRFRGFADAGWHGPCCEADRYPLRIVLVEATLRREA